ncbi:hypothetical protein PLICRDRAFT_117788 [Plicaturopsis crispa FD-325 SS-3]|uniref:Isomerase YbhE n=1 Tax=Plicaturopsis crispa FD-325 SS-3 TaxID=944288 RepID=A0A0C9T8N9_PLICR|nr:hypothetical protein PLICRDRAFT_117788 [Plicaturopsis crispa FD-325 SS-3]
MAYRIITGSYTSNISILSFSPANGSLTLQSSVDVGQRPSWIEPHTSDRSVIFAALEQLEGKVIAIKLDGDGANVVASISSGGDSPCHLTVTDEEVLVSNYMDGRFASIPLSKDFPYLPSSEASTQIIQFHGTGPNTVRQEQAHAHEAVVHGDEVLVPDLGADKIWRLVKGKENRWEVSGAIETPPGGGPRHLLIHDEHLYVLLELTLEIATFRLPSFELLSVTPALSPVPPYNEQHGMSAAEVLIPAQNAAFPLTYIYTSNRDVPSPDSKAPHPLGDTISIFTVTHPDPDRPSLLALGKPTLRTQVHTGLRHLRGMKFFGEDDRYLIAGGVTSGGVKVFERTDGGEGLREVASLELDQPTGFLVI